MALENVAPVLAKDFVFVRIDADRMLGASDMLKRYGADAAGIPWFVFLDGDGKTVATSDHPKDGNIGYPGEEPGATHFRQMLHKAARRMTAQEIDTLVKSAIAFRDVRFSGE
jgi:hypothetical protein